jgi:hypothetical protein
LGVGWTCQSLDVVRDSNFKILNNLSLCVNILIIKNNYSPLTHDKIVHSIRVGAAPRFVGSSSSVGVVVVSPEKSITDSIRCDASMRRTENECGGKIIFFCENRQMLLATSTHSMTVESSFADPVAVRVRELV